MRENNAKPTTQKQNQQKKTTTKPKKKKKGLEVQRNFNFAFIQNPNPKQCLLLR